MNFDNGAIVALLFVFCAICQWCAWKIRLPPIFLLLLTGVALGPLFHLINPDILLGDLLYPFVSLSVAIILFEGSLTLKFREIRGLQRVVRNLVSVGMVVTWLVTALITKLLLGVSWEIAFLFGAIMVVTGPTVVAPILKTVRPKSALANILKWESIVIDPIGASLAVLVFEFIIAGGGRGALGHTLTTFTFLLLTGGVSGCLTGYLFGLCLRYHLIPESLHNLSTLGTVFGSFALSNALQPEAGLITVTVFGVWLANMRDVDLDHILEFKETLSTLLISLLFIILAAKLDLTALHKLGWNGVILCMTIQFLARPLNVMLSSYGSTLGKNEKLFLCLIAPRGIVAAAISALFAFKLQENGYGDAALLVPMTFLIILFTVLFQSLTAVPAAKLLDITLPDPDGYLIVGSNSVARAIGSALLQRGFNVIIADSSRDGIEKAKELRLPTYRGNPISEHAQRNLNLDGIGTLLALSSLESENVAAALHFRDGFGKNAIFSLSGTPRGKGAFKLRAMPRLRGKTLFNEQIGYDHLHRMLRRGAIIQHLLLHGKFNEITFHQENGHDAIPLFAIDPKGQILPFSSDRELPIGNGWKLLFLGYHKHEETPGDYHI